MKSVVKLEVPEFQIGQEVSVYFKDTMTLKGKCEQFITCKECKFAEQPELLKEEYKYCCLQARIKDNDWYCADAEVKKNG